MKTKQEIEAQLASECGTEAYHKLTVQNVVITDGVKRLCEAAECFWLVDAIASYQAKARTIRSLANAQFWTFRRTKVSEQKANGFPKWILLCETGARKAKPVFIQEVPSSDFPLDMIKLYCMPQEGLQVILLPGEY